MRSETYYVVDAIKKDREPFEKGAEGTSALSRCARAEEYGDGIIGYARSTLFPKRLMK
jgi:hypothetical protein